MNRSGTKRGSALLVVLGMLAFIIVSAVGFSVFMRNARLPSSYLRRASATRLLAKGAMASAIEYLDRSVGNNPHPGLGNAVMSVPGNGVTATFHNTWHHRVLFGCTNVSELVAQGYNPTNCPAVLCLEALAYLPPVLVNDARHFSRVSPTGKWKTFAFDAGRYNFTVVDVSDYLDINRLAANVRRTSAPNGRITLSYMLEPLGHDASGDGAKAWDEFMEDFRHFDKDKYTVDFDGKYPLISLADWNLAVQDKGGGNIGNSPVGSKVGSAFCKYLENGGTAFYNADGDDYFDALAYTTFVTDSYFPRAVDPLADESGRQGGGANGQNAQSENETTDLNDPDNQPFKPEDLATDGAGSKSLRQFFSGQNGKCQDPDWVSAFSYTGCAMLFDYLDTDRVPTFMSLPCFERAPMIAAIEPDFPGSALVLKRKTDPEDPAKAEPVPDGQGDREATGTVYYRLDGEALARGFMAGGVNVLTVFPFAHPDDDDENHSYELEGRFSLFFSSAPMSLRTGNLGDALHIEQKSIPSSNGKIDPQSGLLSVTWDTPVKIGQFSGGEGLESDRTMRVTRLPLTQGGQKLASFLNAEDGDENVLLKVVYKWKQTPTRQNAGGVNAREYRPTFKEILDNPEHPSITDITGTSSFPVVDEKGNVVKELQKLNREQLLAAGGAELHLNAAVWLRVKEDGVVVDAVPACMNDDAVLSGDQSIKTKAIEYPELGQPWPLMRFDSGIAADENLRLSARDLESRFNAGTRSEIKLSPAAVAVRDPRFNYAPEHWHQIAGGRLKDVASAREAWLDGRGEDGIYMSTSDAGHLQSIEELAFLPKISPVTQGEGGAFTFGRSVNTGDLQWPGSWSNRTFPENREQAVNHELMDRGGRWNEYDPIDRDYLLFDDLARNHWPSTGRGFKIHPYSDSTNVVAAAIANSPSEWKYASTNAQSVAGKELKGMDAPEFNKKYAFSQYSQDTVLRWEHVAAIAGTFSREARDAAAKGEDWRDRLWRSENDGGLWRNSSEEPIAGVNLSDGRGKSDPLFEVDRKFLHGYWRDCFAVQQQLYLVFVRAEPMMTSSEDINRIPPQHTARAVALVWRDPARLPGANEDFAPHATRVLFYKQFE